MEDEEAEDRKQKKFHNKAFEREREGEREKESDNQREPKNHLLQKSLKIDILFSFKARLFIQKQNQQLI